MSGPLRVEFLSLRFPPGAHVPKARCAHAGTPCPGGALVTSGNTASEYLKMVGVALRGCRCAQESLCKLAAIDTA